jgi:predicted GH43/DUF377 family glycosyl hydrolase
LFLGLIIEYCVHKPNHLLPATVRVTIYIYYHHRLTMKISKFLRSLLIGGALAIFAFESIARAQSLYSSIEATLPFAKYVGNPIIKTKGSAWYASQIFDPCVLVDPSDSTKLIMFASGMAPPVNSGHITIGRFNSTLANPYVWTEVGQVLTAGTPGNFDDHDVRMGSCFYESGIFYIFYTGSTGSSGSSVGLATSTNGTTFTRSGKNPVLTPTGNGRNDGTHVSEAAVIKEGSSWTMVYAYRGASVLPGYRYATSIEGTTWTKGGKGDILTCVSGFYCEFHQLFKIGSDYVLLYESGNNNNAFRLYLASASSPTSMFSKSSRNSVLREASITDAWDRYHVATGWLTKIGTSWRLFYSGAGDLNQPYYNNTWSLGIADLPLTAPTNAGQ